MSDALDRLVRESRPEMGVREANGVDWKRVDDRLFDRIDAERRAERARLASSSRAGRWVMAAGAIAAAAAVALVVGRSHETLPPLPVHVAEDVAGSVASVEAGGQLLVAGQPVAAGAVLHLGDVVEARGQTVLDRPGKLTLVFERGTRATVTHVQGALVLALEQGAVEAQVVPVPSGEAFAVDVGNARVAVHGTHLRVARTGEHVVVDLSEGVVSLGAAPRAGSTLGALVTAPAHAEFSAGDAEGTLDVTHDPGAVRAPVTLATATGSVQPRPVLPSAGAPTAAPRSEPAEPHGAVAGAVAAPHAEPHAAAPGVATPHPAPTETNPEVAIASAVRSCIAEHQPSDHVTLVVSTTVRVEVDADGSVLHARFEPPVAPDVNGCASAAIYRTRFARGGGSFAIPVDVRVPSSAP